jgi:sialate O-acetylesterase
VFGSVFYYAQAQIQGDKIVIYHPKGVKPVAVCYAWSDAPKEVNLFNVDRFSACPFWTDDWKGITVKSKFD